MSDSLREQIQGASRPALLTAVENVLELHAKSPGVRWYGIPRADKSEHYCMADREAWPCSTRRTIELNDQETA